MDTNRLKSFAQQTRKDLMGQVARRLDAVLAPDSAERREAATAVKTLEGRIADLGKKQVVEQVAYTWFNRFTALRYMDVNGYLAPMVVSPAPDQTRPELLAQAAAGAIPDYVRVNVTARVRDLLEGRAPAREPQVEAYRLLVVATCNHLNGLMPYLFEEIADYTELLMPNELLAADGWVAQMRAVMTEDACKDVEVIGWLYQFYISEKKDEVFAGLKKNQKITPENIPAATQLFTPRWIVRYLVENSIGRLWMLNRPTSKLVDRMDYYIAPQGPETDFLRVGTPEEIKVCDPACGSAHMLTYAFDVLHAIYEEEGYDPVDIPALILKHNITGIEIDDRAGALAAFALAMKAAARLGRRRFLRLEVKPDIVVLQNVTFTPAEMQDVAAVVGRDLFTGALRETLLQFEQATNFGSLIMPKLRDPAETLRVVGTRDFGGDLLLKEVQARVVAVLRMAEALSPKYHVVVANPPYMGSSGYNAGLKNWCNQNDYKTTRSDMYAAFIQRSVSLGTGSGFAALVTRQDWVFTKSYEYLRDFVLSNSDIELLALLGKGVFETLTGEVVQPIAFVIRKGRSESHSGMFCNALEADVPEKPAYIQDPANYSTVSDHVFEKIPLKAFIFWKSHKFLEIFLGRKSVGDQFYCREGIHTGRNDLYLKTWWEINGSDFVLDAQSYEDLDEKGHYAPYNKGGSTDKWYGGNEVCIAFSIKFREEMKQLSGHVRPSESLYFKEGGTWADVATKGMGVRYYPPGFLFDGAGPVVVGENVRSLIANMNSKPFYNACSAVMPNLHFKSGTINLMPVAELNRALEERVASIADGCISITKSDWDAYETSWGFTILPLLSPDHRAGTVEATYARIRAHWQGMTDEMQRLEEANNRIFIDAYGLRDELTPEVPIEEITLTCNPAYRYGVKISEAEREARLLEDTMKEFVSYAIGCMFGRYSLDAPGLILANQGETLQDYLAKVPTPTFVPDRDNVIPLLEEDRFEDDAYQRFREFLALTFGEEKLVENLEFMRAALGKEVRAYLAKDFYADHVQRYKKRPIYWLVSSPRGAFQALIYMHRYTPDTLNAILNDYVRTLRDKLEASRRAFAAVQINPDASAAERNRAGREIDKLVKQIAEITEWEGGALYPRVVERIEIDLDDGVKRNYPKFPGVLKPIKGLDEDA